MRTFRMNVGPDGEETCAIDSSEGFTQVQFVFRTYVMPIVYLFGIIANSINVIVFTHKQMRSHLVNWFFLAISISDIFVLFSSFFVFSLPVYAEYSEDPDNLRLSAILIVYFYPIAQTSLTMSVYLTVFVSVHRYLGVCHPFLIRRISHRGVVRGVIIFAVMFAISFNIPRWLELTYIPCKTTPTMKDTLLVIPTAFMLAPLYTIIYRNCTYTIVTFIIPFTILIIVNVRIVSTLHRSHQLRRQMTVHHTKSTKGSIIPLDTTYVISSNKECQVTTTKTLNPVIQERREHGVTVMLIAMTTEFLLFNLLAFANNILELSGATTGFSQVETWLVEMSALLVNINGATTIVIYLIFGTKYRTVFRKLLHSSGILSSSKHGSQQFYTTIQNPNETTQLLNGNTASSVVVGDRRHKRSSSVRLETPSPRMSPKGRLSPSISHKLGEQPNGIVESD